MRALWLAVALSACLVACKKKQEKPPPQITTPLASDSNAAPSAAAPAAVGPCTVGPTIDLIDNDNGEILGTRVASTRDIVFAEWERRGHDDVEGWDGAKPHYAWIDPAKFPGGVEHQFVSYSSSASAPNAVAAPIGGDRMASLVYGAVDWTFEMSVLPQVPQAGYEGVFSPKSRTAYAPPSAFIPNAMEAAGAESSPLTAVAIVMGHDLGGKRFEDCFETMTGLPPCHSRLWGGPDDLAIVAFPKTGAPWTKRLGLPVPRARLEPAEIEPMAIALGSSSGAYAFRYKNALWVGFFGQAPADVGAPVKIRDGKLGAPAMAISGDELLVMWAERERDTDPWQLASMRWDASRKAGPVEKGPKGFAPSLAARDDRVALAWMEGDPEKVGFLHAVTWRRGDTPVLSSAPDLTPRTGNARDPEIALTRDRAFVIWQEIAAKPVIRAASLACAGK